MKSSTKFDLSSLKLRHSNGEAILDCPSCPKGKAEFRGPTREAAERKLRGHMGGKHGGHAPADNLRKGTGSAKAVKNGKTLLGPIGPTTMVAPPEAPVQVKRKYKLKRRKYGKRQKENPVLSPQIMDPSMPTGFPTRLHMVFRVESVTGSHMEQIQIEPARR